MTRILLVEDEASFSEPLSYLLDKEGYEVVVAETGPDAVAVSSPTEPIWSCSPDAPWHVRHRRLPPAATKSNVPIIMLTAGSEIYRSSAPSSGPTTT